MLIKMCCCLWVARIEINRFRWTWHSMFKCFIDEFIWSMSIGQNVLFVSEHHPFGTFNVITSRNCQGKNWEKRWNYVDCENRRALQTCVSYRWLVFFSFCLVLSTRHATISSGDVHSYTYHGNVMVATRLNSNKLSRCQ